MTAAEQNTGHLPELRVAPDVLEHLQFVWRHMDGGFLGTSPDEIHESYTLLARFGYDGGMSAHLAGIEAASGPVNAAAVRDRYGQYADKAWNDGFHLRQFGVELASFNGAAPRVRLGEMGFRPLQAIDTVVEGGGQLIRYRDLARIAAGELTGIYPFMPEPSRGRTAADPYTVAEPERELRLYIGAELGMLRLRDARQLFTAASADQANRLNFWASRLRTPHLVAKMSLLAAMREKSNA